MGRIRVALGVAVDLDGKGVLALAEGLAGGVLADPILDELDGGCAKAEDSSEFAIGISGSEVLSGGDFLGGESSDGTLRKERRKSDIGQADAGRELIAIVGEHNALAVDVPEAAADAAGDSTASLAVAALLVAASDGPAPAAERVIRAAEQASSGVQKGLMKAGIAHAADKAGDLAGGDLEGGITAGEGGNLFGVIETARVADLGEPGDGSGTRPNHWNNQ